MKKNHWKSIESAYRRTPFYEFYIDQIHNLFFNEYTNLVQFNIALTQHLINKLGIDCELKIISQSPPLTEQDLRISLSPKKKALLSRQSTFKRLVIEIHSLKLKHLRYPF